MLLRRNRFLLATVLSVLLCSSLILSAKADASNWVQNYGGAEFDFARVVIEASDGGYALAGFTESFGAGNYDGWLVKTDASGNMQWNQTYGGGADDCAYSLVETSDGGYALAGFTESFGAWSGDGWLVKTDASGNVEWSRTYGGAEDDVAYSLVETSDGGYALAGVFNCSESFYIAPLYGLYVDFNLGGDFWLVKTDAAGNMAWNMTYGGAGHDGAHSLVETSDGGYALAGVWNGTYEWDDPHAGAFWLVKTDASGNMEWNRTYIDYTQPFGEAHWGNEYAYSLVATSDGGYAMAGAWNCHALIGDLRGGWIRHSGFWLVKTDASGNAEWNQTYGGGVVDVAYSLIATSDGGYALAGVTTSFGVDGFEDFWLVKTDEDGVAPVEPEAPWVILPFLFVATASIFISKKLLHPRLKEK